MACSVKSSPMAKNLLTISSPGLVTTPTTSKSCERSPATALKVSPTRVPCVTMNSRAMMTAPPSCSRRMARACPSGVVGSTHVRLVILKKGSGSKAMNIVLNFWSARTPKASVSMGKSVMAHVPVTKGIASSRRWASSDRFMPITKASGNSKRSSQSSTMARPCVHSATMIASPDIIAPAVKP